MTSAENRPYFMGGFGALAGAGLGLLTGKKKGRDALLGALIGAGAGGGLGLLPDSYYKGVKGWFGGEEKKPNNTAESKYIRPNIIGTSELDISHCDTTTGDKWGDYDVYQTSTGKTYVKKPNTDTGQEDYIEVWL